MSPPGDGLLTVRRRWQEAVRQRTPALLRVRLLASYTVDPLVPYLGIGLHDAGLPARLSVGPFNQIMQQCLDDEGDTARLRPDVLVVAPRFEEMGGLPAAPDAAWDGWAGELLRCADAALAAADRWGSCLVYVLPALPESRPSGVGDVGSPGGVVATATLAREALRARLAGQPGVCVADAEEAVREIGTRHAHHPALFRLAKVPYTEQMFAGLGAQLARLLRLRLGLGCRAAVIDADSLLLGDGHDWAEREAVVDALRPPLQELHHAGVRLGVRGTRDPDGVWDTLAVAFPELLGDLLDTWAVDDRPAVEHLRAIAADADVPVDQTVLLTTDPALGAGLGGGAGTGSAVVLGDQPESWLTELRAAGVFDRLPDPVIRVPGEADSQIRLAPPPETLSTADFVTSLNVVVTCVPADHGTITQVAELVERARGFALGVPHTADDIARRSEQIIVVAVRDRLGDYGVSGAVALKAEAGVCTVDLFSLSCPVLGRNVEDAVLREIVALAARDRCDRIVFTYRATGQNEAALGFLRDAADRAWSGESGREVRIHLEPDAAGPA